MDLVVNPSGKLSGKIVPPPSKFYTQFATALALLAERKSVIRRPLGVDDTRALLHAVEDMGATVKRTREKWAIWGVGRSLQPSGNVIDTKNSATALSLMTSIATLAPRITVLTGDAQLRLRPMPTLLGALRRLGADVHSTKADGSPPFVVFGDSLRGGKISLAKSVNPYFLPALMLVSPFSRRHAEFVLTSGLRNSLLGMAVELMRKAGVEVVATKRRLKVRKGSYRSFVAQTPLDLAATAPFITAAVLTDSRIRLSKAGVADKDSIFMKILDRFGVNMDSSRRMFKVASTQKLKGTKVDLSNAPEFLPYVAALACKARGRTTISNATRARNMKSDRIKAMVRGLRRLGAKASERRDGMVIEGPAKLRGREVDGCGDYAIVAALAVLGFVAEGRTVVKHRAEALHTSYSRFVSTFQDLGADIGYST
ncbi:MAG: hypothetical protein U9M97_03310 [Candidatus Hadarchaeota archaeon]|nr:hypothetical protein [Candidatus Hadarchaeota archaeon]